MKKFLNAIIILLLLFSVSAFSACNSEEEEVTSAPETTVEIVTQEDVVIASNGEPVYSIIRYIDALEDEVSLLIDFRNILNDTYNSNFVLSSDWTAAKKLKKC